MKKLLINKYILLDIFYFVCEKGKSKDKNVSVISNKTLA